MKIVKYGALLAGLMVGSLAFAAETEIASKVISVKAPVVDRQDMHDEMTEVFMELKNTGKESHRVIAAYSPIATQVQLHQTTHRGKKVGMRPIAYIAIKPSQEEDLQNGGVHVMLIGIQQQLLKNQVVPITLIFDDGSWELVQARVS